MDEKGLGQILFCDFALLFIPALSPATCPLAWKVWTHLFLDLRISINTISWSTLKVEHTNTETFRWQLRQLFTYMLITHKNKNKRSPTFPIVHSCSNHKSGYTVSWCLARLAPAKNAGLLPTVRKHQTKLIGGTFYTTANQHSTRVSSSWKSKRGVNLSQAWGDSEVMTKCTVGVWAQSWNKKRGNVVKFHSGLSLAINNNVTQC